jgi:hypothetical protein
MTTGLSRDIISHMKTTIDIADELFLRSKKLARLRGLTLRTLVEEGLHASLERHERQDPFRFRPVTVKGKGLALEVQGEGWEAIRQTIYRGRGA